MPPNYLRLPAINDYEIRSPVDVAEGSEPRFQQTRSSRLAFHGLLLGPIHLSQHLAQLIAPLRDSVSERTEAIAR
jgi:hypothetical protein